MIAAVVERDSTVYERFGIGRIELKRLFVAGEGLFVAIEIVENHPFPLPGVTTERLKREKPVDKRQRFLILTVLEVELNDLLKRLSIVDVLFPVPQLLAEAAKVIVRPVIRSGKVLIVIEVVDSCHKCCIGRNLYRQT